MAKPNPNCAFNDPWFETFKNQHSQLNQLNQGNRAQFKIASPNETQKEQSATLYNTIIKFPGESLSEKFNLFVTQCIIFCFENSHIKEQNQLLEAKNYDGLNQSFLNIYNTYQITQPQPENAENPDDKQPCTHFTKHLLTNKNQPAIRTGLLESLFFLEKYHPQKNSHHLHQTLLEFIRQHADAFEFFDLSQDIKIIIHHYLNYFNYQPNMVLRDGCAGCGALAHDLLYPNNQAPTFQLETTSPVLGCIGEQMSVLKNNGTVNHKTKFKLNNPLQHGSSYMAEQTDLYFSFPKMPYTLNDLERSNHHNYLLTDTPNLIPRYDSDALWVQYALHTLKPAGLGFLVVQDGFLKRGGYDAAIRRHLVKKGLLVAVISLHPSHAKQSQYNQLSLLIINKDTEANPNKTVYFWYLRNQAAVYYFDQQFGAFNASLYPFLADADKQQAQQVFNLTEMGIEKNQIELSHHQYNLSYEYYLGQNRSENYPSLDEAEIALNKAQSQFESALNSFKNSLKIK